MKKKKKVDVDGAGFGGSFGDLLRAQGLAASAPDPKASPASAKKPTAGPVTSATQISELGPIRLRFEKKGRRGKTVTVIEGLAPLGDALPAVLKKLKKALGAGATQEDDTVVIQGDQRERATTWLRAQGARDIR